MPIDDSELNRIAGTGLPAPVTPLCPQCGYNLTGLIEPRCPECGYQFDWAAMRRKCRVQWLEALGHRNLPGDIEFGFRITMLAWAAFLMVHGSSALLRVFHAESFTMYFVFLMLLLMEFIMALCGVFLCAHVVRFHQLTEEVREQLRLDVPIIRAWIGLLAAIMLLIALPASLPLLLD